MLRRALRSLPLVVVLLAPETRAATPRARAWLVSGSLGVPSANDEATARDALAVHLPWTRPFALRLGSIDVRDDGSRIVRFEQAIGSVPVLARGARVFLDAAGAPTIATAVLEERATSARAVLDARAAAAIAARASTFAFDEKRAELLYLPGPKLAWAIQATVPAEVPQRPFVMIDAVRGTVLVRGDRARAAKQVRVYASNPVTSSLTTFTLSSLPDGSKTLSSPRWTARTCVDRNRVVDVDLGSKVPMHVCNFEQTAVADAAGDFFHAPPAADDAVDDAFAETSAAYHIDRALSAFAAMGFPGLRAEARPLSVNVNVRMPPSWEGGPLDALRCGSCPLERMDNAFFTPSSGFTRTLFSTDKDGLFFGQGEKLDYAYDGDVVYHELGHAVVLSTADLVPFTHIDGQGAWDVSGAMNEGIADYLSAAVTNDPRIGEYASGGGAIRDLSEVHRCPERVVNESHHDSLMFSGALWAARVASGDRARFDRGVLLGLGLAPAGDLSFEEMAGVLGRAVATEAGDAAAKGLAAAFAERRMTSCVRVRELPATASWDIGFLSVVESTVNAEISGGIVPGALQFHQKLPAGTNRIRVQLDGRTLPPSPAWVGGDEWAPVLLVKWGARPIAWTDTATGWRSDHNVVRELTGTGGFAESIPVPAGTTDLHLMIASRGDGGGIYNNITVEAFTDPVRPDAGVVDASPDAPLASSDAELVMRDDILNGRACACTTPRPAPFDARCFLLGLALLLRRLTSR